MGAALAVPVAEGLDAVWLAPVALALPDAVALALLHTTCSGTVTPAPVQMSFAYLTAVSWSALGQASARQQAMPSRKPELEQMHLMSRLLQPAMAVPDVYLFTHVCCNQGQPTKTPTASSRRRQMRRQGQGA